MCCDDFSILSQLSDVEAGTSKHKLQVCIKEYYKPNNLLGLFSFKIYIATV